MHNLLQRILTAAVAIPSVLVCLHHASLVQCALAVLCGASYCEWAPMRDAVLGLQPHRSWAQRAPQLAAWLALQATLWTPSPTRWIHLVATLGVAVIVLEAALTAGPVDDEAVDSGVAQVLRDAIFRLGVDLAGLLWLPLPLALAGLLYHLSPALLAHGLVANWACDAAAMGVGKLLGTVPLAPLLSPKKTWEGSLAGVVVAVLVFLAGEDFLLGPVLPAHLSHLPADWEIPTLLSLGLMVGVLSVLGDLLESLFKRAAKIQNSGVLFPGHGGILDRMDGLFCVLPALYAVLAVTCC